MDFAFENLIAYQKAIDFAELVCRRSGRFPRRYEFVSDQLIRALHSIVVDITEGV